jgi:hypothetical protein
LRDANESLSAGPFCLLGTLWISPASAGPSAGTDTFKSRHKKMLPTPQSPIGPGCALPPRFTRASGEIAGDRHSSPLPKEIAGDRHSSPLPKSGSGVVSGTCVGMAGFFLLFPTFSQIFYFLTNVLSRKWIGRKPRFHERPKFLGKHWNHGTLPP